MCKSWTRRILRKPSWKSDLSTELFNNNVDKQLIQGQTGHPSNAGVRAYKRPGDKHFKEVSKLLQPPPAKKQCDLENIDASPVKNTSFHGNRALLSPINNETGLIELGMGVIPGTFNAGGNITFNFNFNTYM